MRLILHPSEYIDLLDGQTQPARFHHGGEIWVVRYPRDPQRNLRMASEFVGYRLAELLDAPVPGFSVFMIAESFVPNGTNTKISVGEATGCRWLESVLYPDLEHAPLPDFWAREPYLTLAATIRVLDTWIMNFDRRKVGNVAVRDDPLRPEIFLLDFDQAFFAPASGKRSEERPHWTSPLFPVDSLEGRELLSGFDGSGGAKNESLQERKHFAPALDRLGRIKDDALSQILDEIPDSWNVSPSARGIWLDCLLRRREVTVKSVERRFGADGRSRD